MKNTIRPLIQIAPMMGYTDRHCRYFFRLFSKNIWLFTEMIHAKAILHGNRQQLLAYHENEHPICLQLGGADPNELASATKIAVEQGYDEINLNVGCPSSRVVSGMFGACLMKTPFLVAECVDAMQSVSNIPISIKTRIGIDNNESYEFLYNFVRIIAEAGCKNFIIHARKAWLKGLSPKENREIPPLQYSVVYQLKRDFPDLNIVINGGVQSLDDLERHLSQVDGVMIGRLAYHDPYFLAEIDKRFYGHNGIPDRKMILDNLSDYIDQECMQGTIPHHITRHILGLFRGMSGAKQWRRILMGLQKDTLNFKEIFREVVF